jgi:hypothetical protein
MSSPADPLNPSASPERRARAEAFERLFWKQGAAVREHGAGWHELSLAAWLLACEYQERELYRLEHGKDM